MALPPSKLRDFINRWPWQTPQVVLRRLRWAGLLSASASDDEVLVLISDGFKAYQAYLKEYQRKEYERAARSRQTHAEESLPGYRTRPDLEYLSSSLGMYVMHKLTAQHLSDKGLEWERWRPFAVDAEPDATDVRPGSPGVLRRLWNRLTNH